MRKLRLAVIGGGPIGLETALAARRRGFDVSVYESRRVGEHLRRLEDVMLFTPFGMNASDEGRELLRDAGQELPADDAHLTAADFVRRYLEPLARLAELKGSIREGSRVTQLGRDGVSKTKGILAVGDRAREGRPFLLRVETPDGARFERADVVIDATGVLGSPLATGPGGLPAIGEESLGHRVERHLPSTQKEARDRYAGRRVLLVGDGHSAATALLAFAALASAAADAPRVDWVHRHRGGGRVFQERSDDPLPARRALAADANAVTNAAPWLSRHPGATILAYEADAAGRVRALLEEDGRRTSVDVDRVLALVGYRPDTTLYRELQVHLCYASEAPMDLAAAILSAAIADPAAAGDCLSQAAHGARTLLTPEPGFYIVGAKSYGRNANFILAIGHRQIYDVLGLIKSEQAGATAATTA